LWESQRNLVVTATAKIKMYRAAGVGREEFCNAFLDLDESKIAIAIESLKGLFSNGTVGYWGVPVEVVIENSKVRNNVSGDGFSVFDGKSQVDFQESNRQASVNAGDDGISMIKLRNLRCIPTFQGEIQLVKQQGGIVVLDGAGFQIEALKENGQIRRMKRLNSSRSVVKEVLQIGRQETVDGAIFPIAIAEATVKGESISFVSMYLIEEIRVNHDISTEVFKAAVVPGVQVVDYRVNSAAPTQFTAREEIDNVVSSADEASLSGMHAHPLGGKQNPQSMGFYVLLGGSLVLFGLILVMRNK